MYGKKGKEKENEKKYTERKKDSEKEGKVGAKSKMKVTKRKQDKKRVKNKMDEIKRGNRKLSRNEERLRII